MASEFGMWTYWRDKYYNLVDALKVQYPEVLASQPALRLEIVRIEAYEALIDKIMDAVEESRCGDDDDKFPMWRTYRDDRGYEGALRAHYRDELKKNEPLRIALQNISQAKATLDKWMLDKAAEEDLDDDERAENNAFNAGGRD